MIHKETITAEMESVAKIIFENINPSYYLGGGTALALHIGHRKSIDLDYFVNQHIDTQQLQNMLTRLFPEITISYEEIDTLWCVINGVKCSFISRFSPLLSEAKEKEHYRLASLQDITAMKLQAICGREEYKDYFDLAYLMENTDTRLWPIWWSTVNPHSDQISWMTALSYVDKVQITPLHAFEEKDVTSIIKKGLYELSKIESNK